MSRVFLSHSSLDSREATAVKAWLIEHEPGLAEEIFLDLDPHTGIRPGERWRQALQRANSRCEAVICLLSKHWEASRECQAEFRYAETLNKTILCARLEPLADTGITSEWQPSDVRPDAPPAPHDIRPSANAGRPGARISDPTGPGSRSRACTGRPGFGSCIGATRTSNTTGTTHFG